MGCDWDSRYCDGVEILCVDQISSVPDPVIVGSSLPISFLVSISCQRSDELLIYDNDFLHSFIRQPDVPLSHRSLRDMSSRD
jgi:hypothetical protein